MIIDEHFSPLLGTDLEAYVKAGDWVGAHHLARYHWLLRVLGDYPHVKTVLDAGCGVGYGSYLLASRFPHLVVTAVDHDSKAISKAKKVYVAPNLTFHVADLVRWGSTVGEQQFDVVVCFDVLEHLAHREIMMENLVSHLSIEGMLFLSTPCGHAQDVLEPAWQSHKIEYSAASLYPFLRRFFEVVLRPDDSSLPHVDFFHELEKAGIDYFLLLNPVVCLRPIEVANPYFRQDAQPSTTPGPEQSEGRCSPGLQSGHNLLRRIRRLLR